MKKNLAMYITALTLLVVIAISVQLTAQDNQDHHHKYHHYQLIDMGTFGGPQSFTFKLFTYTSPIILNNHGTLAGFADTPTPDPFPNFCFSFDCYVSHAFQWRNGVRTDLGALQNGFSSASTFISASGLIAGFSQNGEIDPLVPGFPEERAVLWNHGEIVNLGTLEGGYESAANAVNSHGQVVGGASNTIPDSNSMTLSVGLGYFFPGLPYQTRAFLWQDGAMQDLGTLGGTDAQAVFINEAGQVAGVSYTSSTPSAECASFGSALLLTTGSFLWDKENGMVDIGNLGGSCTIAEHLNKRGQIVGGSSSAGDIAFHGFQWDRATGITDLGTLGGPYSEAGAINDHGEVIGGATLPDGITLHAVLWRKGRITDLGVLDGASCSYADGINAHGQIVGISPCDASGHAFLWEEGGPMVDLNTLVSSSPRLNVQEGLDINDRGEITASATLSDGNSHAVLLIPCDEHHPDVEGCDYSLLDAGAAAASTSQANIAQRAMTRNADVTSPSEIRDRARQGHVRQHRSPNLASSNN